MPSHARGGEGAHEETKLESGSRGSEGKTWTRAFIVVSMGRNG